MREHVAAEIAEAVKRRLAAGVRAHMLLALRVQLHVPCEVAALGGEVRKRQIFEPRVPVLLLLLCLPV